MSHRGQRNRSVLRIAAFTMILALCAGVSYGTGAIESIAFNGYQNTSPSLASTSGGLTLALAHSRYLTVEPITLTLTNHTRAPIYLPATAALGANVPTANVTVDGLYADLCPAVATWSQSMQGWQSLGAGCVGSAGCAGGAAPAIHVPVAAAIAPGKTVIIELYNGSPGDPVWSPGAYRFSLQYGLTPSEATMKNPSGLTLTTAPVTLTRAWWSPPGYLRLPIGCPRYA